MAYLKTTAAMAADLYLTGEACRIPDGRAIQVVDRKDAPVIDYLNQQESVHQFLASCCPDTGPMLAINQGHRQILMVPWLATVAASAVFRRRWPKLVHALLLIQIVDHRRVFAGQRLESLLRPGFGKLRPSNTNPPPLPLSS